MNYRVIFPKDLLNYNVIPVESIQPELPERASHNKLNLCLLAFMKDDACRNPHTLIDEFGISIITARKGKKLLVFTEPIV